MVAAVFHMPLEASAPPAASPTTSPIAKAMTASQARPAAAPPAPKKPAIDLRSFWMAVLPPLMGLALFLPIGLRVWRHGCWPYPGIWLWRRTRILRGWRARLTAVAGSAFGHGAGA